MRLHRLHTYHGSSLLRRRFGLHGSLLFFSVLGVSSYCTWEKNCCFTELQFSESTTVHVHAVSRSCRSCPCFFGVQCDQILHMRHHVDTNACPQTCSVSPLRHLTAQVFVSRLVYGQPHRIHNTASMLSVIDSVVGFLIASMTTYRTIWSDGLGSWITIGMSTT